MSDIIELKDNDLEKVTGGAKYALCEVNVGDVFLANNGYTAYIVKSNVTDNGNNPIVPLVQADLVGNTWQRNIDRNAPMSFLNKHTYSQALSGTLNHFLN